MMFIIVFLMLLFSTTFITNKIFNIKHYKVKFVLTAGILLIIQCFLGTIILGLFLTKLNIYYLSLYHLIVTLSLVIIYHKSLRDYFLDFKQQLSKIRIKENISTFILAIFFLSILAAKVSYTVVMPETSADGKNYHIPVLVDYAQNQKISSTASVVWSETYPKNIEMLNLWTIVYDRGLSLLRLPQIFISLLGMVAVYGLLGIFGVNRRISFVGAVIFWLSPFILAQITTTYVDSSLISLFTVALYFSLEYLKSRSYSDLSLLGLTLGFMMGIKSSAIAYVGIFCIVLLITRLLDRKTYRKGLLSHIGIIFGIIAALGSIWYIINWIHFGNPLFPFKVLFFNGYDVNKTIMEVHTPNILKGIDPLLQAPYSWYILPRNDLIVAAQFSFRQIFMLYCDHRIGAMGIIWSLVLFPSFVIYWLKNVFGSNEQIKMSKDEFILLLIIISSFVITPSSWWARYSGFIVIIGILYFCKSLSLLSKGPRRVFLFVTIIALGATVIQGTYNEYDTFRYRQYFTNISSELNKYIDNEKGVKIITFANLKEDNYLLLRGSHTQNVVHSYFAENDLLSEKLNNYGVNSYDKIDEVLSKEKTYDYILAYDKKEYFDQNSKFEHILDCYLGSLYRLKKS